MEGAESPLVKALPPETDYLTYLTIVEYNLSRKSLPILHQVLQDETLTINIGWDLVHLLLPYLPDSESCLHDIARLGNPREVILKVTESLRHIEHDDGSDPDTGEDAGDPSIGKEDATQTSRSSSTVERENLPVPVKHVETPPPLPLSVTQFESLLSLLSILHKRVKTKHPSRFISTSLQAILASFSDATTSREEMVVAIVKTVKALSGTKRPPLPNRQSSRILSSRSAPRSDALAADPEGTAAQEPAPEEPNMVTKLLQSFVTHVLEEYMLNLDSGSEDVPGLAWSSRLMDSIHPERAVLGKPTLASRFRHEGKYHRRIDAVGQLVTLANELKITNASLLSAATMSQPIHRLDQLGEDDPPATADDIPLSRVGSVLLYAARQAAPLLYSAPERGGTPPFDIFPSHLEIFKCCLYTMDQSTGTLGSEPQAIIDAVLAVGISALEHDDIGQPNSDDEFTEYLQMMALLSSNCPSPNLRGHAHYLISSILRSHPDDQFRLSFIRDTLEECPFENIKVSAVGWIKGEIVEANFPAVLRPGHPQEPHEQDPKDSHHVADDALKDSSTSVFATPIALSTLSMHIFPSLESELVTPSTQDSQLSFRANLSFYMASLNFLYLLLSARHLHGRLAIPELWKGGDIAGRFLQPLRNAGQRFRTAELEAQEAQEQRAEQVAELNMLDEAVERVTRAAENLTRQT